MDTWKEVRRYAIVAAAILIFIFSATTIAHWIFG